MTPEHKVSKGQKYKELRPKQSNSLLLNHQAMAIVRVPDAAAVKAVHASLEPATIHEDGRDEQKFNSFKQEERCLAFLPKRVAVSETVIYNLSLR